MTLTCGPPEDLDVGDISESEWKFQGRGIEDSERFRIRNSDQQSILTVNNVTLDDIGKSKRDESCMLTNKKNSIDLCII